MTHTHMCVDVIKSTLADSNTGAGNCKEQEEVAHPPDSGATHPDTGGSRGDLKILKATIDLL